MAVRHDYYRGYMRTNRRFAEIVMSLLREDDVVWVHDHHLMPLGRELAAPRVDRGAGVVPAHAGPARRGVRTAALGV